MLEVDELDSYIKAGKIASDVRNRAVKLIKNGTAIIDLVEFVEEEILKSGAGISFPCNVSVNEITAHYTSPVDDKNKIVTGDLVKLDLGAEVNGYISDTAITIMAPGDNLEDLYDEETLEVNQKIIDASADALEAAISTVWAGVEISKIGEAVEDAIHAYNLNPITNLTGHSLEHFNLHAGISIPNYNNGSNVKLEEGQVVAIEPFATNGIGIVEDTPGSYIFSFMKNKPFRMKHDEKVLKYIQENHTYLPFASRWLTKNFNKNRLNASMRNLSRSMAVYPYHPLKEKTNSWVSQKEHTIIVEEDGRTVTTL